MDLKNEMIALVQKIWVWGGLIVLGMLGMISNNLFVNKKMSLKQAIGSLGVSFFIGVLTSMLCYNMEWDRAGMAIVPMATLLSDKVMMALFAIDWTGSIQKALKNYIKDIVNRWK